MAIDSPARLNALRRAKLMDTPPEDAFDRITRMAMKVLHVPVTLFTVVDDARQFFKSAQGLPSDLAVSRQTPISHSMCQHVVDTNEPIIIEDARGHPTLRHNMAVLELGVTAYLGMPVLSPDGEAIGSLCAIDRNPRQWTDRDIEAMKVFAEMATQEVAARMEKK